MITKTQAADTKINWSEVNRATEIKRTYLVTDRSGRQFYKMYKPSEAQKIFETNGWKGKIVSVVDRRRSN